MERQQREHAEHADDLQDDLQVEISALGGSRHPEVPEGQPLALPPAPLRPRLTRRRAARLSGALGAVFLALLVILGSIPSVRERVVSLLAPSATPTRATPLQPTSSARGSVTALPTIPPGQGWVPAGPADAQTIAFSPNMPATAYACGVPTLAVPNRSAPIAVEVSHDHGHTWQRRGTPALGVTCDLTINPTDAQDIVLLTSPPSVSSGQPPPTLSMYRSFDGGDDWSQWALPFPTGSAAQAFTSYQWAWVNSTLFVAPYLAGEAGYTRLAASVAGRPFAWVNQQGLFAGAPADASINTLLTTTTTLYVMLFSNSFVDCCTGLMRTTDNGASWSVYAPTFHGQVVNVLQLVTNGDGISLFGQIQLDATGLSRIYLRSPDGGTTWKPLPLMPGQLVALRVLASPDETIYVDLEACCGAPSGTALPGMYKLLPIAGTTTWSYVASEPTETGGPIELAWDDAGHPVALWGHASQPVGEQVSPGLETHTP